MPQNAYDHRSAFRSTSHIQLASKQLIRACQLTMTYLVLGLPNGSQRFQSVSHIQRRQSYNSNYDWIASRVYYNNTVT